MFVRKFSCPHITLLVSASLASFIVLLLFAVLFAAIENLKCSLSFPFKQPALFWPSLVSTFSVLLRAQPAHLTKCCLYCSSTYEIRLKTLKDVDEHDFLCVFFSVMLFQFAHCHHDDVLSLVWNASEMCVSSNGKGKKRVRGTKTTLAAIMCTFCLWVWDILEFPFNQLQAMAMGRIEHCHCCALACSLQLEGQQLGSILCVACKLPASSS